MLLLTVDIEEKITDEYERLIFRFLRLEVEKDEKLFLAACETKKSMEGIMRYIRGQAQLKAVKGCAVIPSEIVFSWAKDYVMDPELNCEKKQNKIIKIKPKKLKPAAMTNEAVINEFYSNFKV